MDPFAKATIKKANPAFEHFMNQEEVLSQAQKAKRMPSSESAYRNLVLNQRVSQISPLIPAAVWKANNGEPSEAAFLAGPVRAGLDLSARHDLTALVYEAELDGIHHVRAEFFVPLDGLVDRSMRDRVPYDLWVQQGYITATPGASVNYETVAIRLCELCDDYDVQSIAFDRWRIDVLKAELTRLGVELPLIPFGQGFKDMSPAIDALESELMNGMVRHGDNPVLKMCAANSIADTDPAGNRKLNKAKSTGRIDGMVALAMCMNHPLEVPEQAVSGGFVAL
jgi:phage terminase large subunit-like protein